MILCPRANVLVFSRFDSRNLQAFTTELRLRLLLRPMRSSSRGTPSSGSRATSAGSAAASAAAPAAAVATRCCCGEASSDSGSLACGCAGPAAAPRCLPSRSRRSCARRSFMLQQPCRRRRPSTTRPPPWLLSSTTDATARGGRTRATQHSREISVRGKFLEFLSVSPNAPAPSAQVRNHWWPIRL